MKFLKQWIAVVTVSSLIVSSTRGDAKEYCTDTGGCAYEAAYQSCCLAPAIAFALIAIAGIIAVGVHNRSHSSHDHNRTDCDE